MDPRLKRVLSLLLVGLFWCGVATWFMQWWSVLTLTTVGTVGTLTGCISFVPLLLVINVVALLIGFRAESRQIRVIALMFVGVVNIILMITGTSATTPSTSLPSWPPDEQQIVFISYREAPAGTCVS
jgi:hypothetical protein